jgi:2-amino-4-hydroxy-6-hydroxymethyldihydropteridine diphosphokinase
MARRQSSRCLPPRVGFVIYPRAVDATNGDRQRIFVALGSNLGDRGAHLCGGRRRLVASARIEVVAASRIYETAAVGPAGQGAYLNAVLELHSTLAPVDLLARLLEIERDEGRDRAGEGVRWGPRTLDLDLLLYADVCLDEPGLSLPHPRLHERAFVLEPLCELAGDLVHPSLGGRLSDHRARCHDPSNVRPWQNDGAWPSD